MKRKHLLLISHPTRCLLGRVLSISFDPFLKKNCTMKRHLSAQWTLTNAELKIYRFVGQLLVNHGRFKQSRKQQERAARKRIHLHALTTTFLVNTAV